MGTSPRWLRRPLHSAAAAPPPPTIPGSRFDGTAAPVPSGAASTAPTVALQDEVPFGKKFKAPLPTVALQDEAPYAAELDELFGKKSTAPLPTVAP